MLDRSRVGLVLPAPRVVEFRLENPCPCRDESCLILRWGPLALPMSRSLKQLSAHRMPEACFLQQDSAHGGADVSEENNPIRWAPSYLLADFLMGTFKKEGLLAYLKQLEDGGCARLSHATLTGDAMSKKKSWFKVLMSPYSSRCDSRRYQFYNRSARGLLGRPARWRPLGQNGKVELNRTCVRSGHCCRTLVRFEPKR